MELAALGHLLTGFGIGLALITPIGAQNLFIIQQGIDLGHPRVFFATLATTVCDALLIGMGALGVGALLSGNTVLQAVLMAGGGALLLYLAWQNIRPAPATAAAEPQAGRNGLGAIVFRAMGVSLFNPHAILDTVGVIGALAVTRSSLDRVWFAGGAVLSSLVWFTFLGTAAILVRSRLTPRVRRRIDIASAVLMAGFALLLWSELLHL